jgi:hypothetical protein
MAKKVSTSKTEQGNNKKSHATQHGNGIIFRTRITRKQEVPA